MNASLSIFVAGRAVGPLRAAACAAAFGLCAVEPVHAAHPGPIPVTITNTAVEVSSAASEQPFELAQTVYSPNKFLLVDGIYTVPTGKRLLIKSATFFENTSGGTSARTFTVIVIRRSSASDSYATIQTAPNTGALAGATQPMHLSLRAGERLLATITCSGAVFSGALSFSGVLVDAP